MIKALLTAFCLLTAGSLAAAPKDWSKVVTATADGGYVIGNPKAAISLIEYGSFTCPHCKVFHDEGMPALKAKYIAPGKMRFEFRSFVRNGPDLAATLLARCGGLPVYYRAVDRFYALQDKWTAPFISLTEEQMKPLQGLEPEQQVLPLARLGKLEAFLKPLGVGGAKAAKCLSDAAAIDAVTVSNRRAVDVYGLTGTPTFVLNGKTVEDVFDWAKLAPKLPPL